MTTPPSAAASLPSALDHIDALRDMATGQQLAIFLDYDGTLTPIVERPEDAYLSGSMKAALQALARQHKVAIVSGRGLDDVRQRVGIDALYYAGSHGFEIVDPGGSHHSYGPAQTFLSDLAAAEHTLHERLADITGAQVERKRFAVAIHYRRANEGDARTIETIVNDVQHANRRLRLTGGKKVFELRPDLDWHKGTALSWLLELMGLQRDGVLPMYIGDDVTDEDAFAVLRHNGVGILVADATEPTQATQATYQLADTEAVRAFLLTLATIRSET